ncbi:ATP-binding cassette domain-containing protein [Pseudooceanicola sp. 216_PA32_1]|uniref:ATP-binding cassette domain-containing protein n=1 Tax=Pseudooceanicola pacificus TaxID=2676438 RepID=A0A844WF21_9RHOB|nr:oligopeptide/dipeptide ABC transporter ATP-binding protein [Pseudooceanicola pacificus]MWB77889.1 ATP-binding cassette domain-containing protein [Pseudooceanicola pacificus]
MNAHSGEIDTFLSIDNLTVEYPLGGGKRVYAVTNFTAHVKRGETLGLVGESGCGKSSAARAVMQLPRPTGGKVTLDGQELTGLRGKALQAARRRFQMIFQDPIASLNPRQTIRDIVAAPLEIAGIGTREEQTRRVAEMLDLVGINSEQALERRPHEFSGGQCQRISIARALILEPDLLVCDEAVSALDVSVQAQVLNLLEKLKTELGLTMLFISHDLAVVKHVSDRVAVMYLGKLCELADAETIYRHPVHPYTRTLLSAVPEPDPDADRAVMELIPGELPSPVNPPSGCRFRTRCPYATELCAREVPQEREIAKGHIVACHHPLIN